MLNIHPIKSIREATVLQKAVVTLLTTLIGAALLFAGNFVLEVSVSMATTAQNLQKVSSTLDAISQNYATKSDLKLYATKEEVSGIKTRLSVAEIKLERESRKAAALSGTVNPGS